MSGAGYTAEEYVECWMNSPSHKENIVNPVFVETGFGVYLSIDYTSCRLLTQYLSELFIGRAA